MRYPLLLASCAAFLVGCVLVGRHEVKMRVVDETGVPVPGAAVEVLFVNSSGSDVREGRSGSDGTYAASGRGSNSVMLRAEKVGYYPAQVEGLSKDGNHDVEVVLPRILNPVPLYAMRLVVLKFPMQGAWLGFDFEAADWVAPHGKGKSADILLRFRNEFKGWDQSIEGHEGFDREVKFSKEMYQAARMEWTMDKFRVDYGKWDGVMEISFPGEKEGLVEATKFLSYSRFKMPHSAPLEGYVPSWRYENRSYRSWSAREDKGFFLRTRVKLDKQGNIISANYAKVRGDFRLDAKHSCVGFSYYFNPNTNDRNLEFDLKKNLFPAELTGADVRLP